MTIQFHLNGKIREGQTGMTIDTLLAELELDHQRLAVEVNEDVIPKTSFGATVLQDGDRIEVVSFVGGG